MRVRGWVRAALLGCAGGAAAQQVTAVPALDLNQATGAWYEIAQYPNKLEKRCIGDGIELYTIGDKPGRFNVVTSCVLADGTRSVHNGSGKRQNKKGVDGKLKVSYLFPFYKKQWVLAVGSAEDWALLGSPDHKLLRILAKTSTLPPEVLVGIKAQASAQGFDPGKLVMVPQDIKMKH